jgi:hypothetical protein
VLPTPRHSAQGEPLAVSDGVVLCQGVYQSAIDKDDWALCGLCKGSGKQHSGISCGACHGTGWSFVRAN